MRKIHELQQIRLKLIPWLALEYTETQRKPNDRCCKLLSMSSKHKLKWLIVFYESFFKSNPHLPQVSEDEITLSMCPGVKPPCGWNEPGCKKSMPKPVFTYSVSWHYPPIPNCSVPWDDGLLSSPIKRAVLYWSLCSHLPCSPLTRSALTTLDKSMSSAHQIPPPQALRSLLNPLMGTKTTHPNLGHDLQFKSTVVLRYPQGICSRSLLRYKKLWMLKYLSWPSKSTGSQPWLWRADWI